MSLKKLEPGDKVLTNPDDIVYGLGQLTVYLIKLIEGDDGMDATYQSHDYRLTEDILYALHVRAADPEKLVEFFTSLIDTLRERLPKGYRFVACDDMSYYEVTKVEVVDEEPVEREAVDEQAEHKADDAEPHGKPVAPKAGKVRSGNSGRVGGRKRRPRKRKLADTSVPD